MKKYIFIYYGVNTHEDVSKEDMDKVMAAWGAWYESIGDNLVDGGNPFNTNGQRVTKDEVADIPTEMWPSKGYTIVNAESMEAATKIAKGCPMLKDDPEGTVRVYEAMPM